MVDPEVSKEIRLEAITVSMHVRARASKAVSAERGWGHVTNVGHHPWQWQNRNCWRSCLSEHGVDAGLSLALSFLPERMVAGVKSWCAGSWCEVTVFCWQVPCCFVSGFLLSLSTEKKTCLLSLLAPNEASSWDKMLEGQSRLKV